ncbi:MAG: SDR family NAD(P)-dependent oxidoreductase [Chloroflexota bacterium]
MDVRDKVVLLTGASMGIGLAAAQLLAQHGAKLALVARSTDKLTELADQLKAQTDVIAITADLTNHADIQRMVTETQEHFGRIDVLINNAGQGMYVPVENINLNQYRQIMELNVYGPLAAMQAVVPIMRAQGGGMILNISSGVSKNYYPGLASYASTKYALNALTLTARAELSHENIRVSLMHPGRTATDFGKNSISNQGVQGGPIAPPRTANGSFAGAPQVDTAEMVAERILEAIQTEVPEQYMSEQQKASFAHL